MYGFFGLNGVGKLMMICILFGFVCCIVGEVIVFGEDFWECVVDLYWCIVYVFGDVSVWLNLFGGEVVDLLVWLCGVCLKDEVY